MKDLLIKKGKLEAQIENTRSLIKNSEDVNEVRALTETLEALRNELNDLDVKLADAEKEEAPAQEETKEEERGLNIMATYGLNKVEERKEINPLGTMEYRTAFMNYVQKGVMSDLLKRADAENVTSDLGILLPETITDEIIKEVEKVYGQLYAKVKKLNVKGGVKYPIGSFSANLVWGGTAGTDLEHGVSEKQKGGAITGYVEFTYHIGEIRIAQSLLQSILTVEAFEREVITALVEAYVKAIDVAILSGDGTNQPTGILVDNRVTNVITLNATDVADWKQWQKKLFAKLPLSLRKERFEFVFTAETWESNILTLADDNNNPVARETYNPETGDLTAKFKGHEVVFVEEEGIKTFDTASTGDVFGLIWVPEKAYAVNTNLQFGYKKYFDEATNQYITKALVIIDGKVLDPKYIYLLKKGA